MRRAILLLCCGVLLIGMTLPAQAEKRVALVIGISDYATLSKLNNPVPDARAIAQALKDHGFEVTEYYDLPRAELLDALEEFASVADQASVALVYYAGHGMEMAGKNVLAPKDMEIDCEKKTPRRALDLDQLFSAVSGAPQQIVLLDACRNDPFPQCPARSLGGGSGFRGFTRAGAEDHSLLIANSTLGGQLAADGAPGQHSPFATALLARFSTDASTYLRDLLEGAAGDVQKASQGAQVPEILTRGGAVRICLDEAKCGGVAATPAAPASQAPVSDPALDAWNAAKDTDSASVLEAFIAKFGDSFYASLAKAKLADLNKKQEETKVAIVTPPEAPAAPPKPVEPAVVTVPNPKVASEYKPGDTFKDCENCPEMVVVPAGEFTMGSPPNEKGRDDDEGPQHTVRIAAPFAVGKFEVTRDQFENFVKDTGYYAETSCWSHTNNYNGQTGLSFLNPGFEQVGSEPAVCVSWDDTNAYAEWLSKKTGKTYRLLTEAEWEYAARAGTQLQLVSAKRQDDLCHYANGADLTARKTFKDWIGANGCSDGYVYTSPVGTFAPNNYGLYDMLGNVSEWVEDYTHKNYTGAPTDTSPWVPGGDFTHHILRGGSWRSAPRGLRVGDRDDNWSQNRVDHVGFRVARML